MIIEGAISVKAAISNHKRDVEAVYIDKDKKSKDFNYIRKICKLNQIQLIETEKDKINDYVSGHTHGGVAALVSNRKEDHFTDGDIFFLDGIEDPFNLGYAMRTLYAFGFHNVLLNDRNYENMEAQLLKSSAGAYDMLNIKVSTDPVDDMLHLKQKSYNLYALFRNEKAKDVFQMNFNHKAVYLLGGEKRGVSSKLLQLCDDFLYIPYASDFRNALNACAALDVIATLVYRQRKENDHISR